MAKTKEELLSELKAINRELDVYALKAQREQSFEDIYKKMCFYKEADDIVLLRDYGTREVYLKIDTVEKRKKKECHDTNEIVVIGKQLTIGTKGFSVVHDVCVQMAELSPAYELSVPFKDDKWGECPSYEYDSAVRKLKCEF